MKNENPLAFPTEHGQFAEETCDWIPHSGMSLRDYFAGQALVSLLQVKNESQSGESAYAGFERLAADDAYRFADAMLAERARQED